jgi:hypothetical protein
MLPLDLYARVRVFLCATAHETAGAARTRSSLRPLFSEGANEYANLGQNMSRDREVIFSCHHLRRRVIQYSRGSID